MSRSRFDVEELRRCASLLEACVEDRAALAEIPEEDRKRLLMAAGRLSRPLREDKRKLARAFRRKERARELSHDRAQTAETEIRVARRADVFEAPMLTTGGDNEEEPRELRQARDCYVCKQPYTKLHHFYDSMCGTCAELNYQKRFQTASLEGRTALITGARIKIGFQAALMMLRAGARVLVTTRFPRDAAQRFAREKDFDRWSDRLAVFGLDLRHSPSVEVFARYVTQTEARLDILINNAAQTVRRPPGFYAHMLGEEERAYDDLPSPMKRVLARHEECKSAVTPLLSSAVAAVAEPTGFVAWSGGKGPAVGIRSSALLSQLPCAYDDVAGDEEVFPAGALDADLQQIDLRKNNSWRLKLAEVPSPEMLEVQLVNAVAPFILCSKLRSLMDRDRTDQKHIVNVSAMEGQFARGTKTDKHPHTNMAKAALNMMTLTSAPDYAKSGIFMNAVDTGWVTDEDPIEISHRKQRDHDFQPPLDIVDGAARICDPFFAGLLTGIHISGKFLKDYAPCEW